MALSLRQVLRHTSKKTAPSLCRTSQRRWAQVHDVRFVATLPQSERVFEKYKDKLDRRARELGVKDATELKKIYKETTKPPSSPPPSSPFPDPPLDTSLQTPGQGPPPPPQIPTSFGKPNVKTLSSFLDVPKILELPQKEIESLWRLRHANDPNSLCASIPESVYRKIEATARRHPQFILPVAREVSPENLPDGAPSPDSATAQAKTAAEIHFLQWTFPSPDTVTVLFTHLAEYKLRGEYAQPHTTVTHHLELAGPKGLVLLQGQVMEGRGVSVDEGRWLLMCLQKFYGMEEREERRRLLQQFSSGDQRFKVEELVSEAERIL